MQSDPILSADELAACHVLALGCHPAEFEGAPDTALNVAADALDFMRLVHSRRFDLAIIRAPAAEARDLALAVRYHYRSCCKTTPVLLVSLEGEPAGPTPPGATERLSGTSFAGRLPALVRKYGRQAARRSSRHVIQLKSSALLAGRPVFCQSLNCSSTGMLVIFPHTLPVGAELDYEIRGGGGDDHPAHGRARVMRHARERHESPLAYGLSFEAHDFGGGATVTTSAPPEQS